MEQILIEEVVVWRLDFRAYSQSTAFSVSWKYQVFIWPGITCNFIITIFLPIAREEQFLTEEQKVAVLLIDI